MTNPPEDYPLAAAAAPRLQVVERTGSTNADVVAGALADPAAWPHLSVLLTHDQRAGRGRLDRTWTTPPGTALALSVLVRVPGVPAAARGWIPLAAGAAMTRAVRDQLIGTGHFAALKWPNDVLMDGGKVCGILAEVVQGRSDSVVIGAGVNTRMTSADLPVETAVSFPAVGLECDEDRLIATYLGALDELLTALADANGDAVASGLLDEVTGLSSTIDSDVTVALPDGTRLEGRAEGIDAEGRLVVHTLSGLKAVSAGDVVHVR